jgi:glycosyltransferase involved in cell wall biosynthesis
MVVSTVAAGPVAVLPKRDAAGPQGRSSMRVLWTHNFDPEKPNSQVFMNIAASGLRARGIDLHCEYLGNLRSVRNLAAARRRLPGLGKEFDVVHAQYGSACGFATMTIQGVPKVLSVRGNDWNLHDQALGFHYFHTRLARWMTRRSISHYDAVLTVSRRVAADVQAFARDARIVPMPSPIDLRRFVPRDKKEARAMLGFPNAGSERWVLFNALNLNDPIKRFPLAKKTFELAEARCGNLRLRLATDLPHEALPLFTAACDVILCTSENEGWPNCVKEALACNVPFVSTDVSDLSDIARVETSCRVCPDDPAVLAENLCEVLALDGSADLRKHVAPMSLDFSSERLIGLYESLL